MDADQSNESPVTVEQLVAAFRSPEVTAYTYLIVSAPDDVYGAFLDAVAPITDDATPDDHFAAPDSECSHQWKPVGSTNAAGRAYRCEICWDRTD